MDGQKMREKMCRIELLISFRQNLSLLSTKSKSRDTAMGKARSGAQVKKLLVLIERVCLVSGSTYPAGNFALV